MHELACSVPWTWLASSMKRPGKSGKNSADRGKPVLSFHQPAKMCMHLPSMFQTTEEPKLVRQPIPTVSLVARHWIIPSLQPYNRGTLTWSGKTMHFWFQKWELAKKEIGSMGAGFGFACCVLALGFSRWSWCFNLGLPFLGTASWRVRMFVRALLCTSDVWT